MIWIVNVPRFCKDRGEQFHGFVDSLCERHIGVAEWAEQKWTKVLAGLKDKKETESESDDNNTSGEVK